MLWLSQGQLSQLVLDELSSSRHFYMVSRWLILNWTDILLGSCSFDGRIIGIDIFVSLLQLILWLLMPQTQLSFLYSRSLLIYLGRKGALFQIFINFLLFLLDHFLDLLLIPHIHPVQKVRTTMDHVSLVLLQHRLESTLYIQPLLVIRMFLDKLFLGFHSLFVEMLPYWFGICASMYHIFWWSSFEGRCASVSMPFLGGFVEFVGVVKRVVVGGWTLLWFEFTGYFSVGLEVLLLIKVHCKYYQMKVIELHDFEYYLTY